MKKKISIVCNKCRTGYPPNSSHLIKNLFTYNDPNDSNSYYKFCKMCLAINIQHWHDYRNILDLFEIINVPFIEKLWHEGINITNARLIQSNNNISAALSSISYGTKIDDNLLVIFVLIDEYFKKAKYEVNQQFFFNKGFHDSIEFMNSERAINEQAVADAIEAMRQRIQSEEAKESVFIDEESQADLLDEFGNFKVDMLSDSDYIYLSKKWGLKYNNYELVKLEEYWIKAFQSFEIVTSTHQDLLLKIAKISSEVDNAIDKNEWDKVKDITKLMKDLMDSAQFTPKSKAIAVNRNFKSSIGELVAYLEKNSGFIPRYDYKVSKDLIDYTIENLHNHTEELVRNEVNLVDIAETALMKMQIDKTRDNDEVELEENDDDLLEDEIIYNSEEDTLFSNDNLELFVKALQAKEENL